MKKRLYITMLLATFGFCKNIYAIKGTFYNSISNNTGTDFFSGMEYDNRSDRWDNCGWWSNSGWSYYRSGGNCSTNTYYNRDLKSGEIIGQTGGHEAKLGSTSANQIFFLDSPKGTRKFYMSNEVHGAGSEDLYIKMWCSDKSVLNYQTNSSFGGDPALFIKTIFLNSATVNKVDLGYIVMEYSPTETNKPNMEIDLFNLGNKLSNVAAIGYKKECF